jgi:hypothetical protein
MTVAGAHSSFQQFDHHFRGGLVSQVPLGVLAGAMEEVFVARRFGRGKRVSTSQEEWGIPVSVNKWVGLPRSSCFEQK